MHYHFAGKAELGHRLVTRYTDRFRSALAAIQASASPNSDKLAAYCDLYRRTLNDRRMCLCGMLAAEYRTLAQPMRDVVSGFFDQNRAWLADLLDSGREAGDLHFTEPSEQAAKIIIAALEGAMLIAGPLQDPAILDSVVCRILADFAPS